ncbi:hypothetical protein N865_21240 [Intrasporangium oryzae NRRL B-24470]|uniref:DUF2157 domain-containing protein n=1 Tax=Intrasporangium oryzae NRRL B-24470 TaxID=1386089 RepID=W9G755_9MICO|nr:hypothetical protein [Intrasporangium oryzae]EWS99708.1 hypothetical protein N865_21240 [Intrasporangium oryzae NRRL B-24470]
MTTTTSPDLSALVDRWVKQGIINPDQAARIRNDLEGFPEPVAGPTAGPVPPAEVVAREPATTPSALPDVASRADLRAARATGPSIVVEALAYFGGVIAVVALGLIMGTLWESMSFAARAAFAGVVCLALLGAGLAIPAQRSEAGYRLRAVLWAGGTFAFAATTALVTSEGLHWGDGIRVAIATAALTTVVAAVLWRLHPTPLQHAITFAAGLVTVATVVANWADPDFWPAALAVWVVSLVWAVLSHFEVIRPPAVGLIVGSAGLVVGSMMLQEQSWGSFVAIGTIVAIVGVAVLQRRMSLLAIGAVGTFSVVPRAMETWFPGVLAAAIALLVAGLGLVGVAVYIARHGRR